jgi:hyperosmotically inducible protein
MRIVRTVFLIAPLIVAGCASTRTLSSQLEDANTTREIEYRLAEDETASAYDVDVKVHRGFVVLLGDVEDEASSAAAERIARAAPNVIGVDNRLTVLGVDREAWIDGDPDVLITSDISMAFAEDPIVRGRDIDVESVDGIIYLTGMVATEQQRRRAAIIAAQVPDVDQVVNLLTVGNEEED